MKSSFFCKRKTNPLKIAFILSCSEDDYAIYCRNGLQHIVEILDIQYELRGRIYLLPHYHIRYLDQAWPDEWVWTLQPI